MKNLHAVGFEPTSHIATVELESTPLDHSGKRAYTILKIFQDKELSFFISSFLYSMTYIVDGIFISIS